MLVLRANEVSAKGAKISRNSATIAFDRIAPMSSTCGLGLFPAEVAERGPGGCGAAGQPG